MQNLEQQENGFDVLLGDISFTDGETPQEQKAEIDYWYAVSEKFKTEDEAEEWAEEGLKKNYNAYLCSNYKGEIIMQGVSFRMGENGINNLSDIINYFTLENY